MVVAGFEPRNYGLRNPRHTTELPKPTTTAFLTKYVFIFNMASRTIRPSTCAIPQFQFWLKKPYQMHNKSGECLEITILWSRHNIMNLGNQNSKYSWRIRDLENLQTGTQFANSILMYKMQWRRLPWNALYSVCGSEGVYLQTCSIFASSAVCRFKYSNVHRQNLKAV